MKVDNPFDKKLEAQGRAVPRDVRDAAVFVTDTMDIAWAAALAVFEDKAAPEHAIAFYDRVVERMQRQASLFSAPHQHGTNDAE